MTDTDNQFEQFYKDGWKGDLKDLHNLYTDKPVNYKEIITDPFKREVLLVQYRALFDVYLKNHDEYRKIQTQLTLNVALYTFFAFLSIAVLQVNFWAAVVFQSFLVLFSFITAFSMANSINKSRLFHKYTSFVIRSIENNFELQNIPLRASELHENLRKLIKDNEGRFATKKEGEYWKLAVFIVVYMIPIFIFALLLLELLPLFF
ncbi:MAG: hypothetical protein KA140_01965 [Caldisericia bacterium]|nr:hypothetical protein [Caldisericia bacterium]